MLLSPPEHESAPWSVASDAVDRPLRSDAQIDGAIGHLVGRIDFADRHWIDRIIGYGIAAHKGALFGITDQVLGTLTALFLVMLAVSSAIMWWRRRPTGLLGARIPLRHPRFGAGLVAVIVILGIYMPLFGATLVLVLISEWSVLRRVAMTQRWLGLRHAGTPGPR